MRTAHFCIVHNSIADESDRNCHWDLMAGPRPGRGPCKIREVEIRDLPTPAVYNPGPNEPLRHSVDKGYLVTLNETGTLLQCENCGRKYRWPGGELVK